MLVRFVYYCGAFGPLTAFVFSGNSLALSKIGSNSNQSSQTFTNAGTTPVVSSNRQNAGTGVVWALVRTDPLQLVAYNATNLTGKPLFSSPGATTGPWHNIGKCGAFIEPTVIQGKVYVPSDGQLNVFGL